MIRNTTYISEGLGRLLGQHKDKPRIAGLLTAWLTECQSLEDAMFAVYFDRVLQNASASGDMIDKLGAIVGQPRIVSTDAAYLLLVSARIRANRASGIRQDIIDVLSILMPGATVYIKDLPPAAVMVWPEAALPANISADIIGLQFVGRCIAAGIQLTFLSTASATSSVFLFGDSDGVATAPTANQSFSDADLVVAGGGNLADVITILGGP